MSAATTPKQFLINGKTLTVEPSKAQAPDNGALWTKAIRAKLDDKGTSDLLALIQAKHQQPFKSITVSKDDPEKMNDAHSISKLLQEHSQFMNRFDLAGPYTIVFPVANAFDSKSSECGDLETDANGAPLQLDLHNNYLRITQEQVKRSNQWCVTFTAKEDLYTQDMNWSFHYCKNNAEESLCSTIHAKWMDHPIETRGGPLFLKLLLDEITTARDANLKAPEDILETCSIKKDSKGEDINAVVSYFKAVFNNLDSLGNGVLPTDAIKRLLRVLQTTSVEKFNRHFDAMSLQLDAHEVNSSVDPCYAKSLQQSGIRPLTNDLRTAKFILGVAGTHYRNFCLTGVWTAVLQSPPGQSAFNASSESRQVTEDTRVNDADTPRTDHPIYPRGTCFNCGGDHHLKDCPHPKDRARIDANRRAHPNGSRKGIPAKHLPPEDGESPHRVIDGKPHTWDPNAGWRGRWIEDATPESKSSQTADTSGAKAGTLAQAQALLQSLMTNRGNDIPTHINPSSPSSASLAGLAQGSFLDTGSVILDDGANPDLRKCHANLMIERLTGLVDKLNNA